MWVSRYVLLLWFHALIRLSYGVVEPRNTDRVFTPQYITSTAVYDEKVRQNVRFRRICNGLTALVMIDLGMVDVFNPLIIIKTINYQIHSFLSQQIDPMKVQLDHIHFAFFIIDLTTHVIKIDTLFTRNRDYSEKSRQNS